MTTLTVEITSDTYQKLEEAARRAGKAPEVLTREWIEMGLQACGRTEKGIKEVLQAKGRLVPLGEALKRKIIPGVTLDEVRNALSRTKGPQLSEIVDAQRGTKT